MKILAIGWYFTMITIAFLNALIPTPRFLIGMASGSLIFFCVHAIRKVLDDE